MSRGLKENIEGVNLNLTDTLRLILRVRIKKMS